MLGQNLSSYYACHPSETYEIIGEGNQNLPIILASPHSGTGYPSDFKRQTKLSEHQLRQSEDCYIDRVVMPLTAFGIPLIRALVARIVVDLNREAFELDASMFDGPLPGYVNTQSHRALAGIGTIPRMVGRDDVIYDAPLSFDDIRQRIINYYYPYHTALRGLIDRTRDQFGYCLLVDCHSMPSSSCLRVAGAGAAIDFVIGDCHRTSCDHRISNMTERFLTAEGFRVTRNRPFAGGFTTRHYGMPRHHIHAIQIEINRALYIDEQSYEILPGFEILQDVMTRLLQHLASQYHGLNIMAAAE